MQVNPKSKKPKLDPPLTPSKVSKPSSSVLLEAVVSNVSPLKNKRYVGELVDKTNAISFVGFDQHIQTKIQAMHKQKVPILLRNCDIQFNQYSKKLEVIVKGYTKIEVSKTAFDIDNPEEVGAQTIQLTNS